MADEQDRLRAEYRRLRRSGLSEEEAASRLGLKKSRGVIQEASRGLFLGGAEAVTGLGAGIGFLGRPIGLGGLEEASLAARERAREALDPRGKAGAAGRLIGRIGGEVATTVGTAGLGKLGAARFAPRAAETARAALEGSRAARAAAVAAPDIALSAPRAIGESVTEEGEIDKALLAQNLALELGGSALGGYLATMRPSPRITPETDVGRMIPPVTTRDSRLRGAIIESLPEGDIYGPLRVGETRKGVFPMRGEVSRIAPETDPSRMIPATTTRDSRLRVATMEDLPEGVVYGPERRVFPMRGEVPPVSSEEAIRRLEAAAATREVPSPSIIERPTDVLTPRTRRRQAAYLGQIEEAETAAETAAKKQRFTEPKAGEVAASLEAAQYAGETRRATEAPRLIYNPRTGGFVMSQALQPIAGAGIGSIVGGLASEEDPLGGALGGAVIGAGLPFAAGAMRRMFNETAEDIVERATKEGATPLEKRAALRTARNAIKRENKLGLVPAIEQRVDQRVAEEFANRFGERRTFGFKELDRLAKDVNIEDLKIRWGNGQRLSEADTQALFRWTTGLNDAYEAARLANDEKAESIMQELFDVKRIANTEASRAGLTLRQLREVFEVLGGDEGRYRSALSKALGASRFSDLSQNIRTEFNRLLDNTDPKDLDNAVAEFAFNKSKSSWKDVILDSRRAGLISAVGSWVRNIVGSTEAAIGNIVETPMAAAIDKFVFGRGKEDVFTGIGSRGELLGEYGTTLGKTFGKVWGNRAKYLEGIDPEQPLDILKRKIVNYESVHPNLKVLEKANNFIYGVIAAGDKPFYEAALNTSLRERALLRAAKDPRVAKGSVKIGTKQFDNIVRSFMNLETAVDDDVVFAIYDALNATFKSKTGAGEAIRKFQRGGGPEATLAELVVPFPNTPTNIVRQALERVPGLGFGVGKKVQKDMITKHVNEMRTLGYDVTDQGLENQLRRLNAQLAAKQITGTGLVAAGYLLAKNGSLTPAYTPFIGRTPEEREEARRQGVTGETALSIKLGDRSYNIASLGTVAPLLAMGAALAIHDTEESQPSASKIVRAAGMSALRTAGEMPLLTGARDIVSTFEGGGYARPETFGRQAATFIPLSGAVGSIARAIDPAASRQPRTVAEGFMERIPLARQTVAPRTTALGEVVRSATPVETLISPFGTRRLPQDPLYEDLRTIGFYPSTPTQKLEGETQQEFAERRQESGSIERERLSRIISNFERRYGDVEYISEDQRERLVKSLDKALRDTRSKQTRRAQRVRARRTNE